MSAEQIEAHRAAGEFVPTPFKDRAMKTTNEFIAQQCDQAGETVEFCAAMPVITDDQGRLMTYWGGKATQPAATQPVQPAKNKPHWSDPTTFIKRFGDAMQALCNERRPADELMTAWLDNGADDFRLQDFACEHGLSWAQGIGIIDAAQLLANQPTEGVDHEYRAQPVQPAVPDGMCLVPIEPTPEMLKAGGHTNSEWLNDNAPIGESRYALPMAGVYAAMLSAAPDHKVLQPVKPAPVAQAKPSNADSRDAERYRWLIQQQDVTWQNYYQGQWIGGGGMDLNFMIDAAIAKDATP